MKILPVRLVHSIGVVLTVVLCSTASLANSAYITDKISVDIRSEKSAKGERIKSLPSGTTVEILAR